jgi:hypothetical protein
LEDFVRIAETRYAVGEGIQQDVFKAHVEVSKMVDELIMLGQRRKALEAKLNTLLNRPPETSMGEPEEVIFRKFPFTTEELQKMALEMNPTLKGMKKMIEEHQLNRVVVAACSPRMHEPTFRRTVSEAGLNPFLFEMANIREFASWCHPNQPQEATERAKDAVRMAVDMLMDQVYAQE